MTATLDETAGAWGPAVNGDGQLGVASLHERHGGRWQVKTSWYPGPETWFARPWEQRAEPTDSGPWPVSAATAAELDQLLTALPAGSAPQRGT
jgi:hypothetical protein